MQFRERSKTHVEELDVIQDLVVEGEIIAGDDIGTSILLELPVRSTESLSSFNERLNGDLPSPVSLSSFLELTVCSHTGKPENGSVTSQLLAHGVHNQAT